MKLLHSADWHLDAPMSGKSPKQNQFLRQELLSVPDKIAKLCREQNCDILLLSGDLFDGTYTKESYQAVFRALESVGIPVFIAPGNHDFCAPASPYLAEPWPENVHIFTHPSMEPITIAELDCTVYGAGYESMDCPALLKDFHAEANTRWKIGILHGDPTVAGSPYCPVTSRQVRDSGLDYLALGHIHKGGQSKAGDTLCAWPGCPMGKDFGESGIKGVLLVSLEDAVQIQEIPLDTPRFFDLKTDAGDDPQDTIATLLPAAPSQDFYRITLTGYSNPIDTEALQAAFPHIPNLELRDQTLPEPDLWNSVGEDTLEGVFFRILQDNLSTESQTLQRQIKLAARISRQILDGQEVTLP
ncbi:MAG: DNA repair exonuclease [Oscillospiraceae bacterium]|nr:DNA repair exonuclease [Oscillospiraceae bacterium]